MKQDQRRELLIALVKELHGDKGEFTTYEKNAIEKVLSTLPEQEDGKCGKCKNNSAEQEHNCPYQEDINGDYDTKCNCCEDCRQQCIDDI